VDAKTVDIVLLPEVYEGSAARVIRWLRRAGDAVSLNEPLVEIETDKVMVEIASPAAGCLREILKAEQDATETGDVLGRIEVQVAAGAASGAARSDAAMPPAVLATGAAPLADGAAPRTGGPAQSRAALLSPAVRTLLAERGLEPAAISGSGKDGRITALDVEQHSKGELRSRRIAHTAMRRRIAENMSASVRTAPHVTAVFEADLSAVVAHREQNKADFAQRGAPLSYTAYFLAACAAAFREVPEINSRFHADALEVFEDLNIGIGTALGKEGLVVPVMRKVQDLDLFSIAQRLGELLGRARSGKLDAADVRGGTFTITNHGVSGSLFATPIINQPQCAILGVGKLERRPSVVTIEGVEQVRVLPKCFVSLTIDHRAIDGFQANSFLAAWVACLADWPMEPKGS
jgi:2-oxoglutarate dehydrogenase E2 component (dihydrolipoamide succinyltransferase)